MCLGSELNEESYCRFRVHLIFLRIDSCPHYFDGLKDRNAITALHMDYGCPIYFCNRIYPGRTNHDFSTTNTHKDRHYTPKHVFKLFYGYFHIDRIS